MIQDTLADRAESYGEYKDGAQIAMDLFALVQGAPSYCKMNAGQRYAMFMFTAKMARLLNGDPNHKDSWHDIAGYASLVEDRLAEAPDAQGWVAWAGGACPVGNESPITVRMRNGSQLVLEVPGHYRWKHIDSVSDIVAYLPS